MNRKSAFSVLALAAFFPILLFAADAAPVSPDLATMVGGLSGGSILASVAVLIQVVMKFLNSDVSAKFLPNLSGFKKLLILSGLAMVFTPISLIMNGMKPALALVNGATLAAFSVFAHQFISHGAELPKNPPA